MMRASAATGEAQPLSYRPTGMGQFQHANKAYPDIDLRGDPMQACWEDHGGAAPHRFRVIQGGLGFYQLDLMRRYGQIGHFQRRQRDSL